MSQTLTGLDFSAVTDYDEVASVLQTALRATSSTDLDNAEVDYDSAASAFVVTLPLDSSTGVVPTASAAFTGDDADELGLDTATIVNGVDAIVSGTVTFLSQTVTSLGLLLSDGPTTMWHLCFRPRSEQRPPPASMRSRLSTTGRLACSSSLCLLDSSSGVVPTASAAFTGERRRRAGPGHRHDCQRRGRHTVRERYAPG